MSNTTILQVISLLDISQWFATILAVLVSLLTLYNAAKLKSGILAVSTYAFGAGMLSVSAGLFMSIFYSRAESPTPLIYILFIVGFLLLGYGSYRIYLMSKIK